MALIVVASACTDNDTTADTAPKGGSELLKAQDAKTLTLLLTDLPTEWSASEGGSVIEVNPRNLEDLHTRGDLSDTDYNALKSVSFRSLATRTFAVRGDGSLVSTVAIFESVADAQKYYGRNTPAATLEDAPKFGDESYSERAQSGTDPNPNDNTQVVDRELVRTVARVANVVVEVSEIDDPGQLDTEESLEIADTAVGKLG